MQYHHALLFQPLPGMKPRRKIGRGEKRDYERGRKERKKEWEGGRRKFAEARTTAVLSEI